MEPEVCRHLFSTQPVAHLATIGATGPHLVPIVFAVSGNTIVSSVDHKPKRSSRLKRLANIEANSAVSVLADFYSDDWGRLWWVRADGTASIFESGRDHAAAVDLLVRRYEQYHDRPPHGPVISISVTRWSGWRSGEE